jgi:FkbM family methyltransferase
LRGWTGLCVDPNPDFKRLYGKIRPNDIFLNIGISDEQGSLEYYKLKDKLSVRNSFSKEYIDNNNLNDDIEQIYNIQVKTLNDIFNTELDSKQIDFLTIDVEGLDLQVLKGNDWNKHRPSIICVESHLQLHEDIQSSTTKFMTDKEYILFGKTMQGEQVGTLFYKPS